MKIKNFLKLFLLLFLLLGANTASASCFWTLHNKCKDMGTGWVGAKKDSYCSNKAPIGATKKCCCGTKGVVGCCKKEAKDNTITTADLSSQACQEITYASTTFYQDQKANSNTCIDKKKAATCKWRENTDTCNNGESKSIKEKASEDCREVQPQGKFVSKGQVVYPICCCSTPAPEIKAPSILKLPAPTLQISIPGLTFEDVECPADESGAQTCRIPWMSQYIVALYNYGLSIVGILAAIILMAGGLLWLTSAGDNNRISQAKEFISGSSIGLIITFSSFIILYTINPALVSFEPISLDFLKKSVLTPEASLESHGNGKHTEAKYCGCMKWKDLKNSTMTADDINAKLNINGSQIKGKGQMILDLAKKYNIDPSIPLTIWRYEGSFGQAGVPLHHKNIGDLICPKKIPKNAKYTCVTSTVGGVTHVWRHYEDYSESIIDWFKSMSTSGSTLNKQPTLRGFILRYGPPTDSNDPQLYINLIVDDLNKYHNNGFSGDSDITKCSDVFTDFNTIYDNNEKNFDGICK